MKIPRENWACPHFIIQTIIYTAKGGLDESSPYNKPIPHDFSWQAIVQVIEKDLFKKKEV
jgi:hypothetical protein